MNIIKILLLNWDSVLLVIAAAGGVVALYKRGEIKILKDILFRLVTRAEAEFGNGTGELKRAAVIEWLYGRMPGILRLVVTRKDIDKLIDEVLTYAKDKWAKNKNLRVFIEREQLKEQIISFEFSDTEPPAAETNAE